MLIFTPLELKDKPLFDFYYSHRRNDSSDLTFANLFIWRQSYSYEWMLDKECLWLKGNSPDQIFMLSPLGEIKPAWVSTIETLRRYFAAHGYPFLIKGATGDILSFFARNWPKEFLFSPDSNNFDYVYRSSDLINLAGSRYRSKRNHINHFKRCCPDYRLVPITDELIPELIAGLKSWSKDGKDVTAAEMQAVWAALIYCSDLGLTGEAIIVKDKIEAFSLGEELNDDTFVVHIEKANPHIRGLYQVINQEFSKKSCAGRKFINREEDMGIAGIRTAKQSYHPVRYTEKFDIIATAIEHER